MEALMNSSLSYLKLSSFTDHNKCFHFVKVDLLSKALLTSPVHHLHYNKKSKVIYFKLSFSVSSTSTLLSPVSLASSHTQVEVKDKELQLEESLDTNSTHEGEAQTIRVKFQLQRECAFGQHFLIVGNDSKLGLWDPNNAIPLTWSDGHVWTAELDIPIGKCIKFKFVMQESKGNFLWQPGPDRILELWETEKTVTLCEDWENPDLRMITVAGPMFDSMEEKSETTTMENFSDLNVRNIIEPTEPKLYTYKMKERLITTERVPVLVPGLSPLPTKDTHQKQELVNGGTQKEELVNDGTQKEELVNDGTQKEELVNDGTLPKEELVNEKTQKEELVNDRTPPKEELVNEETQKEEFVNDGTPPKEELVNEGTQKVEVESTNGAAMVSKDLKLPELDWIEEHVNKSSNSTLSTVEEEQVSCEETQDSVKSLFHEDIKWGKSAWQKILNSLGIR